MSSSTPKLTNQSKSQASLKQLSLSASLKRKEPTTTTTELKSTEFGNPEHKHEKKLKLANSETNNTLSTCCSI